MQPLKWPQRLTVVRHGQSEQNVALDLPGSELDAALARLKTISDADIRLTELGVWQAHQTGVYLASTPQFDICLSSPYIRAIQTADAIVTQLGYDVRMYKDNRLREKEFGRLHGFSHEEIQEKYPEEYGIRRRDGKYRYRMPGGENYPDVEMRVHSFLDKLHRDYVGASVLVVTHQVPYVIFRALFEHLDEQGVLALGDVPNCGIEEFLIDTSKKPEGRLVLSQYNRVAYP